MGKVWAPPVDKGGVEVLGYRELGRTLRRLGDVELAKDLVATNKQVAMMVAREATYFVPFRSGDLFKSIRGLGSQKGAQVRAGAKTRVPYAGPIHFGWARHGITPNPFLYKARDARIGEVKAEYERQAAIITQRAIDRHTMSE